MFGSIGFIGAGNMARAIIGGITSSKILPPNQIFVRDIDEKNAKKVVQEYGVKALASNLDLVKNADIIILAVKPQVYDEVIGEIKAHVSSDALIISMAAGITIEDVKELFDKNLKVIRIMPNTPAMVGEGMTAMTSMSPVDPVSLDFARKIFSSFGKVIEVEEALFDAVTATSGSSPAFAFIFIEAMADAGVLLGLPREKAYILASQAVLGSARLVLESGKHPGELKDMVCSPAGTTIEGVRVLEERGMRSALIEAMIATAQRAGKLKE